MRNSIYKRYNDNNNPPPKPIENSLGHPNSIIRQFLNMRRVTKDKGCLIIFLLYSLALVVMMGIGFFYGNYSKLGVFVNDFAPLSNRSVCDKYVNMDFTECVATCNNYAFLGRVCLNSNTTSYNPSFSSQINGLLAMYDIKYTFPMIVYISAGLMAATALIFIFTIYFSKTIYIIISSLFFMLLGMAFYLLKNVQVRILSYSILPNSIFYTEEQNTRSISFVLLGLYLVIFPFILFSPKKIKLGVLIIGKLKQFYSSMSNMILFTMFSIAVVWGSLILEIFLIMHFYTAGTVSQTPQQSMFYTYQDINLSHAASLTFHFIGIFWLYGTVISWHKYFMSSAMCLWYFQDSQNVHLVKRGLKRSLHHLGSAALDGILMPVQWILLLLYAVLKTNDEQQEEQREQQSSCINGCFKSFRLFFMSCYRSVNRTGPSSAVLTNYGYFQSCQNSTQIFSLNSHRFFNIGGILTIFLTLFVCILWIIVIYFVVYAQVFVKSFPPVISQIVLPVFCVFIIGLVVGSLFSNIFTAPLDCLLYCYLMEKKSLSEGAELERNQQQLKIKKLLNECYLRSAEQFNTSIFIYEQVDQNTLDITYVSKKQ